MLMAAKKKERMKVPANIDARLRRNSFYAAQCLRNAIIAHRDDIIMEMKEGGYLTFCDMFFSLIDTLRCLYDNPTGQQASIQRVLWAINEGIIPTNGKQFARLVRDRGDAHLAVALSKYMNNDHRTSILGTAGENGAMMSTLMTDDLFCGTVMKMKTIIDNKSVFAAIMGGKRWMIRGSSMVATGMAIGEYVPDEVLRCIMATVINDNIIAWRLKDIYDAIHGSLFRAHGYDDVTIVCE